MTLGVSEAAFPIPGFGGSKDTDQMGAAVSRKSFCEWIADRFDRLVEVEIAGVCEILSLENFEVGGGPVGIGVIDDSG